MADELTVKIASDAWVKEANSYMNLDPQFKTFFPDDCFIARGTGRENQHLLSERGIRLEYQGVGEVVQCFMELRSGGQFRPSNRGAIKAFYKATGAKLGDGIGFIKLKDRAYKVVLAKSSS
jgi:hypothetical protein